MVIGRNEADILMRSLGSVGEEAQVVVYADSASTDGSAERARETFPHVDVVDVPPMAAPSPARGRNAGFARLLELCPDVEFVQFLDGDCDLAPDWLENGLRHLEENPDVGVLYGRLRERDPDRNAYHRLADMEWDLPVGEVDDGGGIMLTRRQAWEEGGGQNEDMPAGEEREFLRRVLAAGWKIVRLPEVMAHHDIDMATFAEWWRRNVRMGHHWAQGMHVHRDRQHLRELRSIATWSVGVPTLALAGAVPTLGASLPVAGLAYRAFLRKMEDYRMEQGGSREDARLWAWSILGGRFAGAVGVAQFLFKTLPAGRGGRRHSAPTDNPSPANPATQTEDDGPATTVVSVTYNARKTVDAALTPLKEAYDAGEVRVIVADNASADGTEQYVRETYPWVDAQQNGGNLGFARGCNAGFANVRSKYVLFLNPDAALTAENLRKLVAFMEAHPPCAIAGPAMVYPDGGLQAAGMMHTPLSVLREAAALEAYPDRRLIEPGGAPFETNWVGGACMLIRSDVYREVGMMDERFFLYFEETDLMRKVRARGYEIWAVGEAVIGHEGGAATKEAGGTVVAGHCIAEHYFPSRYYYLRKNFGLRTAVAVETAELGLLGLRTAADKVRLRSRNLLKQRLAASLFADPRAP